MITIYGCIVKWFWLFLPPPYFYFLQPKKEEKKPVTAVKRHQRIAALFDLPREQWESVGMCLRNSGIGETAMTSGFGRLSCSAATVIIVRVGCCESAALTLKTKCLWSLCNSHDLLFSSRSLRGQKATPVRNQ